MSRRIWSRFGRPPMLRPTSWEILKSARYTMGRKTALRSAYPPRRLFRYESWVMKASHAAACCAGVYVVLPTVNGTKFIRSEEHTSELQSPCNLVCRLLLEKKNSFYTV